MAGMKKRRLFVAFVIAEMLERPDRGVSEFAGGGKRTSRLSPAVIPSTSDFLESNGTRSASRKPDCRRP